MSGAGSRRSRRKRSQASHRREKMKEFLKESSRELAKGSEWSMLFLGLIGCLAGVLVTFLAGHHAYAVLLLLLASFLGAALWKREAA